MAAKRCDVFVYDSLGHPVAPVAHLDEQDLSAIPHFDEARADAPAQEAAPVEEAPAQKADDRPLLERFLDLYVTPKIF